MIEEDHLMEVARNKRFDLHVHSKYSKDGFMDIPDILRIAVKRGLSGIALTDHNTIKGALKAKNLEAKKPEAEGLRIIVGSEIMTERGEVIGLFLSEEIRSREFHSAITEIKDQDGLVIIPHPFDDMRSSALQPDDDEVRLADAVEVFNSRCVFQKYNDRALELAMRLNLGLCAGSDAHFGNEIGIAGIIALSDDPQEIKKALSRGDDSAIKIYGRRSPLINHAFTKVLKIWRRARSG
jgi:predicted metal-dependent phosphoesterase TrpH